MEWPQSLIKGKFVRRYQRFFADVEINGRREVAHVPNTGSLKTVLLEGQEALLSVATQKERKLKLTLEALRAESGEWVGVNTTWPNRLAQEAFKLKKLPHWKDFYRLKSEVKTSKDSRLDLLLESQTGVRRYVEIKNVTLKRGSSAQFPDAITTRGQKHLRELMRLCNEGFEAEILFTVQRGDVDSFSPADEIDPEYGELLRQAQRAGVLISAYVVSISQEEILLTDRCLKLDLEKN